MKTKLFAALTALTVVFAACKKDNNNDNNNGGTTEDYQPTSAGSTWQYNSTTGSYTETAAASSRDSTIDGEKYVAFDNSNGGTRYVNKNNGVYKSYSYFQQIQKDLKLTYLKDADAGTTWQDVVNYSYNGIDIPITFSYTIASRDRDTVVNNKTYNNVIVVDTKVSASSLLVGGDGTIGTARRYYAKGVGAISSTLNFNALGITASDTTYLVSYNIK